MPLTAGFEAFMPLAAYPYPYTGATGPRPHMKYIIAICPRDGARPITTSLTEVSVCTVCCIS